MRNRNSTRWRSIKEVFMVLLMLASTSAFWSLIIAGVIKLTFELSERVAVLYIGGGIFFSIFLLGIFNYKKIAIYVR